MGHWSSPKLHHRLTIWGLLREASTWGTEKACTLQPRPFLVLFSWKVSSENDQVCHLKLERSSRPSFQNTFERLRHILQEERRHTERQFSSRVFWWNLSPMALVRETRCTQIGLKQASSFLWATWFLQYNLRKAFWWPRRLWHPDCGPYSLR